MKKDFSLSNDKAMINFTAKYCTTMEEILDSNGFERILSSYIDSIKNRNSNLYKFIQESLYIEDNEILITEITNVFKLLIIFNSENQATGIYYYKLSGNGTASTKKMVIVK